MVVGACEGTLPGLGEIRNKAGVLGIHCAITATSQGTKRSILNTISHRAIGEYTHALVGLDEGPPEGAFEGLFVGREEGDLVGAAVDGADGALEGALEGAFVVDDVEGAFVGAPVLRVTHLASCNHR